MEYNAAAPIYLQVINDLKKKMVKGELKPGEKMPKQVKPLLQNTAKIEEYC